ncbi:MAG: DinB family protein [Thermomicrobiales bacterium]
MAGNRVEVDALLRQFDRALEESASDFSTIRWHSMLGNLSSVRPEDWDVAVPGGVRTIRELVIHVGGCYLMYQNHGFGDRTMHWKDAENVDGLLPGESMEQTIAWFRAAHDRFRSSLDRITDDQLDEPTQGHWGGNVERRRVVELMIQHTVYHAGEVNYIRALLQGNDA